MRKRAAIVLCVLVLACAGTVAALRYWDHRHEPKYQGKMLAQWLKGPFPPFDVEKAKESAQWLEAADAVRHMGTNAIPPLLKMVQAKDSTGKARATSWWYNVFHAGPPWTQARDLHQTARLGFSAMDPQDAQAAIPTLTTLMLTSADREIRESAYNALCATAHDYTALQKVIKSAIPVIPTAAAHLRLLDQREVFLATNGVAGKK